jgi:DNA helicase-2/ATP-dependent DNA helicase PcrA
MSDRVAIYNALQRITRLEPGSFDDKSGGIQRFGSDDGADPSRIVFEPKEAAALLDHANAQYLTESRSTVTGAATSWLVAEESVTAVDVNEYVKAEFWGTYTGGQRSTHYLNKRGRALGSYLAKRDFDALGNALRENHYPTDGSLPTKVYTIHASKGNEAETVAVYDGITGRIRESMNRDEAESKNEFRTWYVALTRASSNLLVLKHGFDFTKEFLPRGGALMESARQGVVAADGGGSA